MVEDEDGHNIDASLASYTAIVFNKHIFITVCAKYCVRYWKYKVE